MPTQIIVDIETGEETEVELAGDALAQWESDQATGAAASKTQQFAGDQDTERLGLISERAQSDPAFAALAEFVLRGRAL